MIHSPSSLNTFEQCPYKYKLKYIDKIDPIIKDTIESFLGRMVHQTLEKLYTDLQYKKTNNLKDLLTFLHQKWYENWNDEILIVKKQYTMKNYFSLAQQYITEYYKTYKPFTQHKTIAIENHIIFPLDQKKEYKIQGYIDRLSEKKPGNYQIHDYKTSSRLPTQNKLDKDRQLGLYALGILHQYPDVQDITLVWHFLKFNKELHSKRSLQQLEKLKAQSISLIKKIENTSTFPRNTSPLCHWCEYKPICPQHSHLYQVKNKTENRYMKQTGQQLVDRYAELERKTQQIQLDCYAELEQIKQTLINYANRDQLDVIYGSHLKVNIDSSTRFKLPEQDSKEWHRLIKLLKEKGKLNDVSTIDSQRLNTLLKNNGEKNQLLAELLKIVSTETKKEVHLSDHNPTLKK